MSHLYKYHRDIDSFIALEGGLTREFNRKDILVIYLHSFLDFVSFLLILAPFIVPPVLPQSLFLGW